MLLKKTLMGRKRYGRWALLLAFVISGIRVGRSLAEDPPKKPQKAKQEEKSDKATGEKKKEDKIRWGKRRNESDAAYDKRYAALLRKIKKDKAEERAGGPIPLYTLMPFGANPFIVRTDVSPEFTADTAMYMEMLHREYGLAYSKLLQGLPATIKEPVEVVVFEDRDTYMKAGGHPGSGGQFMQAFFRIVDRGDRWPAAHYRLMQFTDGIKDFAKWPKSTLKHEAAHMELQMRLGFAVDCPRWWNEGHACCFEFWDFDKTVDENFQEIPFRGRYAPFVRRIFGTDKWKDFHYVWTIDPQTWSHDMTSIQGYLNYCEAWSLAAYMMCEGAKGRADFNKIFTLSIRVGADHRTTHTGKKTLAWEDAFPEDDRTKMEKNWTEWVEKSFPRDKKVKNEELYLKLFGMNPNIVAKLEPYSEEELKTVVKEADEQFKKGSGVEK